MTQPDTTSLVDLHSHLVPGVDDGARTVREAVESVKRMAGEGIHRMVTTPHIRASLTLEPAALEERLSDVSRAFDEAKAAIREALPAVEYLRGHEIMIDVPEPELDDPRLRMAGTSFVLIEWPRLQVPPGTTRVLEWIVDQGYRPIIAHPERYADVPDNPGILSRWKSVGALLQVNYGSLSGRYGTAAEELSFRILEWGMADYLSSDFHGRSGLRIYRQEAWDALAERDNGAVLDTLCRINPSRLIDGLDPLPAPPLASEPRLLRKLRGMIRRRGERVRGGSS